MDLETPTQAGDCAIDEVGELKGVGLVWFCPKGVANILSQFRMVVCSEWRMTYDTQKYHRTGDIDDLSYHVTTPEGHNCKFSPTPQGLHIFKMKKRDGNDVFRSKVVNNHSIFGGACHLLMENQDQPNLAIAGVPTEGNDANSEDLAGVSTEVNSNAEEIEGNGDAGSAGVSNQKKVRFEEAAATIAGSRSKFSKRDQIRADKVQRLQHMAGFPSDETLIYSVMTNGARNNLISRRGFPAVVWLDWCFLLVHRGR